MKPGSRPLTLAIAGRGVVDPDEPVIHADDAGLLRGLAVFETLRVYHGEPFAMPEHLARLALSAERLHLHLPATHGLAGLAREALGAAGEEDCWLRFTVTGGRSDTTEPVAMVAVLPLPTDLEDTRQRGISVVGLQLGIDPRLRQDSPWLLDGVKSTSYAVNMAAWDEARRRGADDAIFVAAEGSVLEGPVTNTWWCRDGALFTPSLDMGILAGVTRAYVIRLARETGYEVHEGWFPLTDLAAADEAFTSSSVRELMPIVSLDGNSIGSGRPGSVAIGLQATLRAITGSAPPTR